MSTVAMIDCTGMSDEELVAWIEECCFEQSPLRGWRERELRSAISEVKERLAGKAEPPKPKRGKKPTEANGDPAEPGQADADAGQDGTDAAGEGDSTP